MQRARPGYEHLLVLSSGDQDLIQNPRSKFIYVRDLAHRHHEMAGGKRVVSYKEIREVEPIRRPPKSTGLDARPARHRDDRKAAAAEQFERLPMLRRHLLIDQQRHSVKIQCPLRAEELHQPLDDPMTKGHRIDTQQRPGAIELDNGCRTLVDDRADLIAVTTENQRIEGHLDRNPVELVTLDVEAEFRAQSDRTRSAVGDRVLETGDEHGPGDA